MALAPPFQCTGVEQDPFSVSVVAQHLLAPSRGQSRNGRHRMVHSEGDTVGTPAGRLPKPGRCRRRQSAVDTAVSFVLLTKVVLRLPSCLKDSTQRRHWQRSSIPSQSRRRQGAAICCARGRDPRAIEESEAGGCLGGLPSHQANHYQ